MSFSLCKTLLFIISCIIVDDGLCKILCFFLIWVSNFFSDNLVLTEDQLILISYKNVRLKEKGPEWKRYQTWMACHKSRKYTLWSLNFKNHTNYTILVPQYFSNLILVQNLFLLFFSLWLREEREWSPNSSNKKRKVLLIPI